MYYVNNIINTIVGFIFLAIICLVIFGLPAAMTVWNIISLTPKKDKVKNRRKKDIATLLLGFCLTAVMVKLISSYHWDEPVMIGGDLFSILHEPFSSDYVLSLVLYAAVPIACMMIAGREKLLPPLVGAFCIGGIYGGIVLCAFYTSQLIGGVFNQNGVVIYILFLLTYVLNYLLMAVRIISGNVKRYLAYFRENDIHPNSAFGVWAVNVLSKASGWVWFPLICLAAYLHLYPFRAGTLGHYQSLYRDLRLDLFNDDISAARALHRSLPLHRGGERSRKACEAYPTGSPSGREDWS